MLSSPSICHVSKSKMPGCKFFEVSYSLNVVIRLSHLMWFSHNKHIPAAIAFIKPGRIFFFFFMVAPEYTFRKWFVTNGAGNTIFPVGSQQRVVNLYTLRCMGGMYNIPGSYCSTSSLKLYMRVIILNCHYHCIFKNLQLV